MTDLDPNFIERQRHRLLRLQAELTGRHLPAPTDLDRDQRVELGDAAQADDSAHLLATLAELGAKGLADVEAALRKLVAGTYGLCELTGAPISKERLAAVPHARYSVEVQRKFEAQRRGLSQLRRSYGVIERVA